MTKPKLEPDMRGRLVGFSYAAGSRVDGMKASIKLIYPDGDLYVILDKAIEGRDSVTVTASQFRPFKTKRDSTSASN